MNLILPQAPADADQKLKDYAQEVKKALQGLADQLGTSTESASTAFPGNVSTLANNSADANNDIDMTFQVLASGTILTRASTLTKRLDASWAYGTGQGGLDTGAKAVSTWYAVWAIGKTTGEVDALFSLSSTAPTMPNGWTLKKLIGWIYNQSSNIILPFTKTDDTIKYKQPVSDRGVSGPASTNRIGYTITCPPNQKALITLERALAGNAYGWIDDSNRTDATPLTTNQNFGTSTTATRMSSDFQVFTDSNRQVFVRCDTTSLAFGLITNGFIFNI